MITVYTERGNFDTAEVDFGDSGVTFITGGRRLFVPYAAILRIEYPALQ